MKKINSYTIKKNKKIKITRYRKKFQHPIKKS